MGATISRGEKEPVDIGRTNSEPKSPFQKGANPQKPLSKRG